MPRTPIFTIEEFGSARASLASVFSVVKKWVRGPPPLSFSLWLNGEHGAGGGFLGAAIDQTSLRIKSHFFAFVQDAHGAIGARHD